MLTCLLHFVKGFKFTSQRWPYLYLLGWFAELTLQSVDIRESTRLQALSVLLIFVLCMRKLAYHLLQIPLIFVIIDIHGSLQMPVQEHDLLLKFLVALKRRKYFIDLFVLLSQYHLFFQLFGSLEQFVLLPPSLIFHWVSVFNIWMWYECLLYRWFWLLLFVFHIHVF